MREGARGGREGRRKGGEGYWGAREGGREVGGGRGEGGRLGREGGRGGTTVIHILIGMLHFFLYRNVLFMNSNMMHMLPTVHIIT